MRRRRDRNSESDPRGLVFSLRVLRARLRRRRGLGSIGDGNWSCPASGGVGSHHVSPTRRQGGVESAQLAPAGFRGDRPGAAAFSHYLLRVLHADGTSETFGIRHHIFSGNSGVPQASGPDEACVVPDPAGFWRFAVRNHSTLHVGLQDLLVSRAAAWRRSFRPVRESQPFRWICRVSGACGPGLDGFPRYTQRYFSVGHAADHYSGERSHPLRFSRRDCRVCVRAGSAGVAGPQPAIPRRAAHGGRRDGCARRSGADRVDRSGKGNRTIFHSTHLRYVSGETRNYGPSGNTDCSRPSDFGSRFGNFGGRVPTIRNVLRRQGRRACPQRLHGSSGGNRPGGGTLRAGVPDLAVPAGAQELRGGTGTLLARTARWGDCGSFRTLPAQLCRLQSAPSVQRLAVPVTSPSGNFGSLAIGGPGPTEAQTQETSRRRGPGLMRIFSSAGRRDGRIPVVGDEKC